MGSLELVLDAKALLGEGPSWDDRNKVLFWVDIAGQAINIYNPADSSNRRIALDQMPGTIVPTHSEKWIAALEHGFHDFDPANGSITKIVDPESHIAENRFNDGKCDPAGRLWAGTMGKTQHPDTGALYRLTSDGEVATTVTGVRISNGLGWSPDNKFMYYIDSPTKKVDRFEYDIAKGTIQNRQTIINLPDEAGLPDGMTVDEEGMLWVAEWGGWRVGRWNPATGELLEEIKVPVEQVSSCCFGGEHLDELYITTARTGLTDEQLANQPLAGGLFRIKLNVKGQPTYRFGS